MTIQPAQAYPLQWPENMPRSVEREKGKFKSTLSAALNNVKNSIVLFGRDSGRKVEHVTLSSNVTLGAERPSDPGVAAWFVWDGTSVCIPVDRYTTVEANLQAIHHIIEARRVELRHGTLNLVRATMTGFKALPPPPGKKARRPWTEVLGLKPGAPREAIEAAFRDKSKTAHPDRGGTTQAMQELVEAKREALGG